MLVEKSWEVRATKTVPVKTLRIQKSRCKRKEVLALGQGIALLSRESFAIDAGVAGYTYQSPYESLDRV